MLDYSSDKKLINSIDFSKVTSEKIVKVLNGYNTTFIFDVCFREQPMFIIDIEKITGKFDNSYSWSLNQDLKKRKIEKFLSNFS